MKGSTVLSIPALVIAVWLPPPARACGDKIVDISRGVRFQRACRAEAAPGRDLHESIIGVDAGRLLTRVKNTYVHLRLSHAFVEELAGISTDRTNGEITVGTFVTPALTLSVSSAFQDTHGGLTDVHALGPHATVDEFLEHDRLLADDNVRVGIGAAYALSSRWSVNAGLATVVSGSNSHYGQSYLLGLQWTARNPQ